MRANPAPLDFVRGDATGLLIPAHSEALAQAGIAFLTECFQVFGSLSRSNRVVRITRFETSHGGSTGQKLLLSIEYAKPDPGLHADLFVKFSRDFGDSVRDDRGKHEMESEIRFASISNLPAFPVSTPKPYFADYHRESNTGLLITQRIAFGVGNIEAHREKSLDHDLPDPLAHYRVIVTALARIAAAHKSGRLGADIAVRFPFDPEASARSAPIAYDERQLHNLVMQYADFAANCPQLLPDNIRSSAFIARLDRDVGQFLKHEMTVKRFLLADPAFIALCHWNAQIDNAWFWRENDGRLHCGLIDWGHVNQMNVAAALWGSLCAAELTIWDRHLEELLALFAQELQHQGGPRLDVDELLFQLKLHAAMMCLSYFLESPARILFRLPEAVGASSPLDSLFRSNETARNNLHVLTVVLNFWQTHDLGTGLQQLLRRNAG